MIHSRAGLLVLAAIAAALAGFVAARSPTPPPVDQALVPGFDADKLWSLAWNNSGITPTGLDERGEGFAVERGLGAHAGYSGWSFCRQATQTCHEGDSQHISDVLAALRGARWHRREQVSAAGTISRWLQLWGPDVRSIGLGQALEGADQRWLVMNGAAVLVDGWVARALFPEPLDLVIRYPLDGAEQARRIRVRDQTTGISLDIDPASHQIGGRWIDPQWLARLEAALDAVEIASLPRGEMVGRSPGLRIDYEGARPERFAYEPLDHPVCPHGQVPLVTWTADACVDAAAWREVAMAALGLADPTADLADPHLGPFEPSRIELPDGSELQLGKHTTLALHDATVEVDSDRVSALLGVLRSQAPRVDVPRGPAGGVLELVSASGETCHLALYPGGIVVRREDRVAFRLPPEARAILDQPASAYRDPTRWLEDPSTVSAITLDGTTYKRGAVIGEWTGAKAPADAALVEALAAAVAAVRAPSGPAPVAVEHRLDVTIAPPVGTPSVHHLEVGHPTAAGCAGRADGTPVVLPLAVCTAVAAVSR